MKNVIIGKRLKSLRESLGKSQAQIAELNSTVAQTAIYRYEHGVTDVPNDILLWYADFFDVSLDYIYGRTDKPQGITCIKLFRPFSPTAFSAYVLNNTILKLKFIFSYTVKNIRQTNKPRWKDFQFYSLVQVCEQILSRFQSIHRYLPKYREYSFYFSYI